MLVHQRTATLIATMAAVLAGCRSVSATSPENLGSRQVLSAMDAAEALWLLKRPLSYHVREQRICECLPAETEEMVIYVTRRQGATSPSAAEMLVRAEYVSSGAEVPSPFIEHVSTVEQLFDLIREAVARHAARVDVTYDPTYGFPTRIVLDYDAVAADDEFEYRLSGLTADS